MLLSSKQISAVYRFSLITALIYSALCYTEVILPIANTQAQLAPPINHLLQRCRCCYVPAASQRREALWSLEASTEKTQANAWSSSCYSSSDMSLHHPWAKRTLLNRPLDALRTPEDSPAVIPSHCQTLVMILTGTSRQIISSAVSLTEESHSVQWQQTDPRKLKPEIQEWLLGIWAKVPLQAIPVRPA